MYAKCVKCILLLTELEVHAPLLHFLRSVVFLIGNSRLAGLRVENVVFILFLLTFSFRFKNGIERFLKRYRVVDLCLHITKENVSSPLY